MAVRELGTRLLARVPAIADRIYWPYARLASGQHQYIWLELHKTEPVMLTGIYFQAGNVLPDHSKLLSECATVPSQLLKQACYAFIARAEYWKAQWLVSLKLFMSYPLPGLDFSNKEKITASYPDMDDDLLLDTFLFLLDWLESSHAEAKTDEKIRFGRAALIMVGILNESMMSEYLTLLGRVWEYQSGNMGWTNRNKAEQIVKMDRKQGSREFTLQPLWKRHGYQRDFQMMPFVFGETLYELKIAGRVKAITLPVANRNKDAFLHIWSPKKSVWFRTTYTRSRQPVPQGSSLDLPCGHAYGLGRGGDDLDMCFLLDEQCHIRKAYYE